MSRRGIVSVNTYVDVDVDPADLEDAGYHHEDDCPAKTGKGCAHPDRERLDDALEDLHQQAGHGTYPVRVCLREPCRSLYLVPIGDANQVGSRSVA